MNTLRRIFSPSLLVILATVGVSYLLANLYIGQSEQLSNLLLVVAAAAVFVIIFYKIEWSVYALIFALPFNGTHIVSQFRATEFIAGLMIIAYFVRVFVGKQTSRIPLNFLYVILSFFLFVNTLSIYNAILPSVSVKRVLILTYLVLSSYVIGQVVNTEKILRNVVKAFLICATLFGVYGVYQFFSPAYRAIAFANVWNVSGFPRITLFYGDPNLLSGYLLVNIILCLALLYNGVEKNSWWLKGALTFSLIDMVLTFSRSGVVGAIVGFIIILGMNAKPAVLKRTGQVFAILLILLLASYSFSAKVRSVAAPALDRLTRLTDTSVDSVGARVVAYSEALQMAKDHPILGVGPDMFPYEYDLRTGITAPEPHVVPHNLILEILAEKGILGLLVFFGIMGTLLAQLITKLKQIPKSDSFNRAILQWLLTAFIAFLFHTLFLTGLYEVYLWVLIGLTYAITSRLPWSAKE